MFDDHGATSSAWEALKPYLPPLLAALLGRLIYHAREVQAQRRKPFSAELLWELPIALGMGFVVFGTLRGVSQWWPEWAIPLEGMLAVSIVLSYLGPRIFDIGLIAVLNKFKLLGEEKQ